VPLFELSHNETTTPSNTMKSFTARVFRKPSFSLLRRKKNKKKAATTKKTPSALEDLPAELEQRMTSVVDESSKCMEKDLCIETPIATTQSPFPLEELPAEVKQRMASFLSMRDLLNLLSTSKCIHRDLDITVVSSPLTDPASQNKSFDPRWTRQCIAVVIPNQESPSHATTFSCDVVTDWNPRGHFMCRNGDIWIVEQNLPENNQNDPEHLKSLRLRSGLLVADGAITAGRDLQKTGTVVTRMVLPFYPKIGKFYQFWIHANSNMDLNNMTLNSVGLSTMKPSDHTAFQFDLFFPKVAMMID